MRIVLANTTFPEMVCMHTGSHVDNNPSFGIDTNMIHFLGPWCVR